MSRLLIFDSLNKHAGKSDDTLISGQFNVSVAETAALAVRSNPVRCFNVSEEQRIVGIEFILTDIPESSMIYALRWWPEFYSDTPSLALPPTERDWLDLDPRAPWGRPVTVSDGGTGNVDVNPIQYRMNMQDRLTITGYPSDCIYMPLSVHGLWSRIAVWIDYASSTGISGVVVLGTRLRIFAHLGGHSEDAYLEENGDKIYNYNAYKQ